MERAEAEHELAVADGEIAQLASEVRLVTGRLWRRLRQEVTSGHAAVTPVRLGVLTSLERLGPSTIGDLAAAEQMHASTMTRIIDALEEHGLAVRCAAEHDRRAVVVQLTESGRMALENNKESAASRLVLKLERFSPDERDELARLMPLLARLADGR